MIVARPWTTMPTVAVQVRGAACRVGAQVVEAGTASGGDGEPPSDEDAVERSDARGSPRAFTVAKATCFVPQVADDLPGVEAALRPAIAKRRVRAGERPIHQCLELPDLVLRLEHRPSRPDVPIVRPPADPRGNQGDRATQTDSR